MTNERDDELHQLLGDQTVPEHGPDFWTDLDATLAAEPAPGEPPADVPLTDDNADDGADTSAPAATEIQLETDDAVVTDIATHPRFRRWGLAVISVAAVAIATVVGVNLIDTDEGPPPTSTGGGTTSVPTSPEDTVLVDPAVDYSVIEQTMVLGTGTVAGWTPDGSGVLVVDDAPGEELGAEGAELLTLYVRPIDGGDPYAAFTDGRTIQTGGADFAFGRNGDVAWAEWCDGVGCGLHTGQVQSDGTIAAVTEIPLPDIAEPSITDLEWGADGTLYFAMNGTAYMVNMVDVVAESLGGENVRLLTPALDPLDMVQEGSGLSALVTGPDVIEVEVGPLSWAGAGLGRAIATSTGATATKVEVIAVGPYDGGPSITIGQLAGMAWAPAGDTVFWFGDGLGAFTVESDGTSEAVLRPPTQMVGNASVSPDGTGLAISTIDEGVFETEVLFFGTTSDDTSVDTPTDPPAGPTPIGLIDGVVVGLLDDDNALVLRDELVAADFPCDASVTPAALWRVPLDGSEPELLASPTGNARYQAGPGGLMALLTGCDALTTLTIEDLANDNAELFSQNAAAFPSDAGEVIALTEIDWVDESTLLVTGVVDSGGGRAWRVEVDTGVIDELPYEDVLDVAVGLGGELLVLGQDYFFSTDEPTPLDGDAVPAVTANGPIAYNRDGALWRLGLDEPYADFEASRLFVSPDGSIVVAIERETIGIKLLSVESAPLTAETRTWTTVDSDGEFGFFTSDGQAFVYTANVEDSGGGDRDGSEVRLLDFSGRFEITQPSDPAVPEPSPGPDVDEPASTLPADPPVTQVLATPSCTAQTPPLGGSAEGIPDAVRQGKDAVLAAAAACDDGTLAQLAALRDL